MHASSTRSVLSCATSTPSSTPASCRLPLTIAPCRIARKLTRGLVQVPHGRHIVFVRQDMRWPRPFVCHAVLDTNPTPIRWGTPRNTQYLVITIITITIVTAITTIIIIVISHDHLCKRPAHHTSSCPISLRPAFVLPHARARIKSHFADDNATVSPRLLSTCNQSQPTAYHRRLRRRPRGSLPSNPRYTHTNPPSHRNMPALCVH